MFRWLLSLFGWGLFLALCLILQDRAHFPDEIRDYDIEAIAMSHKAPPLSLTEQELARQQILASLATFPGIGYPAGLPWGALTEVGKSDLCPLEAVLHYQPLHFLEMCLERYEREVKGYETRFCKRERVQGNLRRLERIDVHFREEPFSVHFNWLEGAGLASKVLYVQGENKNKLLARVPILGIQERAPDDPQAKNSSRYTIDQFGIHCGAKRTVASMRKARDRGALHLEYHGRYKVSELGDRVCYKFVRKPYSPLEEEGLYELIIFVDTENWLQVGSILKDPHGNLIAEYFFRDIKLNPEFSKDQFTRAALK